MAVKLLIFIGFVGCKFGPPMKSARWSLCTKFSWNRCISFVICKFNYLLQ